MSRPLWLSGFVCGLAIFASAAQGEDGPGKGRGGREEMMKKLLEKFDADKDGKLSDDERAKAKEAFAGKRPDGAKPGEGRPGKGAPGLGGRKPNPEQAAKFREQMMSKFDKDGDGKLSDDEKAAAKEAFAARKKKE